MKKVTIPTSLVIVFAILLLSMTYLAFFGFSLPGSIRLLFADGNPLQIINVQDDGIILFNAGNTPIDQVNIVINDVIINIHLTNPLHSLKGVFIELNFDFYNSSVILV